MGERVNETDLRPCATAKKGTGLKIYLNDITPSRAGARDWKKKKMRQKWGDEKDGTIAGMSRAQAWKTDTDRGVTGAVIIQSLRPCTRPGGTSAAPLFLRVCD